MVHNNHAKYINFRHSNFHYSKIKELKMFREHLFSNTVKVMLFMSDAEYYVPIKLCRTAGSIHLFKITGKFNS